MNDLRRTAVVVATAAVVTGSAHAGPPPNDECSSPTSISGDGTFPFDTTAATTGAEGQDHLDCPAGQTGIANDVWYCWTAPCSGIARIDTCGQTQLDTKIALYEGCGCPTGPAASAVCCNDNTCGLQSQIACEVLCGQQYLIQLGQRSGSPPGTGGAGTFTITCVGDPCDPPPCAVADGDCCFGAPAFADPDYASFTDTVAAVTASSTIIGGVVLEVIDLSALPGVPSASNFPAARYNDPSWTGGNLGSIFGVTLDRDGNIYVTASTAYAVDMLGAAGSGSYGDIYRIHGVSGAISVFATLPQDNPPQGPGLGNISYDCAFDQFFVTNHEDGRIYRLDTTGACLSAFDHADGVLGLETCAPDAIDAPGFAPLGERLWGVEAHGGRVYYGVWWEHAGSFSASTANEVWSIALDATGEFVPGSEQIELSLPMVVNANTNPGNEPRSNPVSDIRFTPDGRMLLAEHGMGSDSSPTAHQARILEYVCANGTWAPGNAFTIGVSHPEGNSAGGVDIEYAPNGRVWATGDALQFGPQFVYGIQGLPASGGNVGNSHIIDFNGDVSTFNDKNKIGDVVVTCPSSCLEYVVDELVCDPATGDALLTITFTNSSDKDAHWALVPSVAPVPNDGSVTLAPNAFPLPPLPNDGTTTATIQVTISGADPGETVCFPLALADQSGEECCSSEVCVEVPDCDCMQVTGELFEHVECLPDGTVEFDWTFTVQNLTPGVVEWLFITPPTGFDPSVFDLPSVAPNGTHTMTTHVSGVLPGQQICVLLSLHDHAVMECCSTEHCITAPPCDTVGACVTCDGACAVLSEDECAAIGGYYCGDGSGCAACAPPSGACCLPDGDCVELSICECTPAIGTFFANTSCADAMCPSPCPGDADGDGDVDVDDMVAVITSWGPCAGCPADFDNDGDVDVNDLITVIVNWGCQ